MVRGVYSTAIRALKSISAAAAPSRSLAALSRASLDRRSQEAPQEAQCPQALDVGQALRHLCKSIVRRPRPERNQAMRMAFN